MPDKLKSRKFWFALLGALLPIVAQALTNDIALDQALQASVAIVISYLFGQSYVDAKGSDRSPAKETPSDSTSD